MLKLIATKKMLKDIKRCQKRGYDLKKLDYIVGELLLKKNLLPKYKDHALSGDWKDYRECHIENDWLLIYKVDDKKLILVAVRTGTHSDFGW